MNYLTYAFRSNKKGWSCKKCMVTLVTILWQICVDIFPILKKLLMGKIIKYDDLMSTNSPVLMEVRQKYLLLIY